MGAFDLPSYLNARRVVVDEALDRLLPPDTATPPSLHRAMRYSVQAGGKRLRPILVIAGAESVGGTAEQVMETACAMEMIHTYSLIHDDLPAMDNDDYRRGMLTNHKVFGEAIAILAGDALLTLAFKLIALNGARAGDATLVSTLVTEVAEAAGTDGMVGGQVVDIESEGKAVSAETLDYIHTHKTAALIRASLCAGAVIAGGTHRQLDAMKKCGEALGLAFQIVDDILDVEGSTEQLGKTAGKDAQQQKATYPAYHGLEVSRAKARALIDEAKAALAPLGERAVPIRALADFIFERRS
ncbi:MAG: polyprenyl synthetase family protein [Candidatus Rokubacteria bacterium]|nr:polyprenyl synthetase family protein [Candidatus Rokubacteria bacterium]